MEKNYTPKNIEKKWYQFWHSQDCFSAKGQNKSYCIMIPPPNVTGSLHMGHAFQDTIMDTLIRYHRMQGDNTLWQMGTDHAGIATQMVVERQLHAKGKTRHDLGREAFIDQVWQWKAESGNTISQQLKEMGASLDWSRERFTMDEGLSKAVMTVFIQLYEEGLIYRGKRLVNWDPKLHTAVSDLEVESKEEQGHLWHIRYPLVDSDQYLVVATTRPETMLGDSAVAVHPKDERFTSLIGKKIKLPLTDREITIITDDYVDPKFGSGCVKITPAHDFNDYEVGKRHNLALINIFNDDASISDAAPKAYQGLDRYQARKQILLDLEAANLLEKTESHTLKVPRGDRSGVVIEPYLTNQWYVSVKSLAKPAINAVKNGEINFVPKQWENTYFRWMEEIQDWCISRQLWWGHRIPAWYDDAGNIYVGIDETSIRKKHQIADNIKLKQDDDVLDTWFSSALWTFSTLGWPDNTPELKHFHPTNVLVTGFDIIFFWVARMIMMSLKFTKQIPFETVYVHGLVRDPDNQKMSKSKGNVIDPLDLIHGISLEDLITKRTNGLMQPQMKEKIIKQTKKHFKDGINAYGTDALRFTFCSLASTGRDIQFDLNRTEGYRNFCNKLWNAARYVLINCENQTLEINPQAQNIADKWIRSRLQHTTKKVRDSFDGYRFDHAAHALYDFVWNEYCDWYLELSKPSLLSEKSNATEKASTRATLVLVLEEILRLAHPIIPFITEEIWQRLKPLHKQSGNTIMLLTYPSYQAQHINDDAEQDINWIKAIVVAIRNIRGEMNISPGKSIPAQLHKGKKTDKDRFELYQDYLCALAKLSTLTYLKTNQEPALSATQVVGDMAILVPMKGLINVEKECARLNKKLNKLQQDVERLTKKLSNEKFINNAPTEVVNKEKDKLEKHQQAMEQLKDKHEELLTIN